MNTSVKKCREQLKRTQSGVEGHATPQRAKAFGATVSTKSRSKAQTTRQAECKATKPHTGHRYLEGGTSNNLDQAAQRGSPEGWGGTDPACIKRDKQQGSDPYLSVNAGW